MSMTNDDVVGQFLNEQARVNALNDEGDVNITIEDVQIILDQELGLEGLGSEVITTIDYGSGPRHWGDDDMVWGFFVWG
jgi:hypothetical protein